MGKTGKAPYLLVGFGLAGALLSTKQNRDKMMDMIKKVKEKTLGHWGGHEKTEMLEKAGRPDPYDVEDAKMVGEGAQYSVEYYNKKVQQP